LNGLLRTGKSVNAALLHSFKNHLDTYLKEQSCLL